MSKLIKFCIAIVAVAATSASFADTVSYTGNTETSADGSWMRPDATFMTVDTDTILYSVQAFTVGADGLYDISSVQGLNSNGDQYDGFIFLYANSFDPFDPLSNGAGADDDGATGAGSSEIMGISLSAGTTYYLVTSAFDPAITAFGSGAGPFTNTISGPGDVTLSNVPLPAAAWLLMSGLLGLGVLRRR